MEAEQVQDLRRLMFEFVADLLERHGEPRDERHGDENASHHSTPKPSDVTAAVAKPAVQRNEATPQS